MSKKYELEELDKIFKVSIQEKHIESKYKYIIKITFHKTYILYLFLIFVVFCRVHFHFIIKSLNCHVRHFLTNLSIVSLIQCNITNIKSVYNLKLLLVKLANSAAYLHRIIINSKVYDIKYY
jgi:hypothetical protein